MQLSHADAIRIFSALETDTQKFIRFLAEDLDTTSQFYVDCAQHNLSLMARIEADVGVGSLSMIFPSIETTKKLLAARK